MDTIIDRLNLPVHGFNLFLRDAAAEDLSSYRYVRHLWEMINTDEFRAVRERAVAENDA